MNTRFALVASSAALIVATSAAPALAVGNVDYSTDTDKTGYSQVMCSNDDGTYTSEWGSLYPASTSGSLDRVEFWSPGHNGAASNYTVEVRTVVDGLPTDTILASEELTWDELSPQLGGYIAIDFAVPANVTAGETYAVLWTSDLASCSTSHSLLLSTGPYDVVSAVWSQNDDPWSAAINMALEFRAYVTADEGEQPGPEAESGNTDEELAATGVDGTFGTIALWSLIAATAALAVSRRRAS